MNEYDYGIFVFVVVIYDNVFWFFDVFLLSKVVILFNELFEKLQSKYMVLKRLGVLGRINGYVWYKLEEGIVMKLEDLLEKSIKLQFFLVVIEESLDKILIFLGRLDISSVRDNSDDLNKIEDSVQLVGNLICD